MGNHLHHKKNIQQNVHNCREDVDINARSWQRTLRDRLIFGLHTQDMQRKVLKERRTDQTPNRTRDICRSHEGSSHTQDKIHTKEVNRVGKRGRGSNKSSYKQMTATTLVQELATKGAAAAPGQELGQKGARPSPTVAAVDFPTLKKHVRLRRPSAGGVERRATLLPSVRMRLCTATQCPSQRWPRKNGNRYSSWRRSSTARPGR